MHNQRLTIQRDLHHVPAYRVIRVCDEPGSESQAHIATTDPTQFHSLRCVDRVREPFVRHRPYINAGVYNVNGVRKRNNVLSLVRVATTPNTAVRRAGFNNARSCTDASQVGGSSREWLAANLRATGLASVSQGSAAATVAHATHPSRALSAASGVVADVLNASSSLAWLYAVWAAGPQRRETNRAPVHCALPTGRVDDTAQRWKLSNFANCRRSRARKSVMSASSNRLISFWSSLSVAEFANDCAVIAGP